MRAYRGVRALWRRGGGRSFLCVAVLLPMACWTIAQQAGDTKDPCQAKTEFDTATRLEKNIHEVYTTIETPPEVNSESDDSEAAVEAWLNERTEQTDAFKLVLNQYNARLMQLAGLEPDTRPQGSDWELMVESWVHRAALEKKDPALQRIGAAMDKSVQRRYLWLTFHRLQGKVDKRLDASKSDYAAAIKWKDEAVSKARSDYEAQLTSFRSQRDVLQSRPHDEAYRKDAFALVARTRAALMVIKLDLAPFSCWPDVKNLIAEIEAKIQQLEAIRNGEKPPTKPAVPAQPAEPTAWECDTTHPIIDYRGYKGYTATASEVTFRGMDPNGPNEITASDTNPIRYVSGKITWRGVPKRLRPGDTFHIFMSVEGEKGANPYGNCSLESGNKILQGGEAKDEVHTWDPVRFSNTYNFTFHPSSGKPYHLMIAAGRKGAIYEGLTITFEYKGVAK